MDRISDPRNEPSKVTPHDWETNMEPAEKVGTDVARGDLIELDSADAVLAAKMHLLNEAINEIGWTTYHLKLFFLNGFGFAVDSLLTFIIGVVKGQVALEMQPSYNGGAQMALYVGLLFGALFWGLSADMIGRKWAFNLSLLTAAIFSIAAGASPNYPALATFVSLAAFGAGGNLVLDTTVFLEFLPSFKQYLVVTMALWWGVGQTIAGLLAWAFMTNFSCASADDCPMADNMGWRYLYYTSGAFVLVLSILRIVVLRFRETPKYLLCSGQDEAVISLLTEVATKYDRPCSLTLEHLQHCGSITTAHASSRYSLHEIFLHYRGLFATRKLSISTSLLWASWACIGLAYPLYYMFLPEYLASRGAKFGEDSPSITWRNYALTNFAAIFGPIFAGYISTFRIVGRKYTMVIGALMTMAFFFGYTAIRNNDQNIGLSCAVSFTINVYFSVLYAYTPEVLPSAHRATGNGTAVSCARVGGIMAVVIGTFADTSSPEPIYICAALFIVMAILIGVAPYEPQHGQSI
ncbi:major facilitator superfamily domain-containing protein [Plectosphaerella plurivora]|uniref:Major facilitator superfamily domain-containing protein n=1 Tax=Plectosphaerella plurivora TaxID=936078 RepID=A0A9P8V846_9PEZI|nr:major facilitator superfamily domain-containing protein [Plectosphaerella plurivora]